MLFALFVPTVLATTVSIDSAAGSLDGQVVASPTQILVGGHVSDAVAGHQYRVRVALPDGTVAWARPTAGGAWSLAAPVAIATVPNQAIQTFTASLFDRTAGHIVDAEVATILDLTPFAATMGSRTAYQRDAWRFHVTPAAIDDLEGAVMNAVAASGGSLDDRLAAAIPPGSEVTADEGGCEPTAGMDGGEWDTLWELALPLLEILLAGVPGAYSVLETLDDLLDHARVCFEGVYPVIEGLTMSPATFDLAPTDGGLDATIGMGQIEADLEMTTSVSLHLDLSDFEVDIFGIGVSASDFGIDVEDVSVSITDLGLCDARWRSGPGAYATSTYEIGILPSDRASFAFRDSGAGDMNFGATSIEADGVCGWGIFENRLERAMDNVDDEVRRAVGTALGLDDGADSFAAVALTQTFADMETSGLDVLDFREPFSAVQGEAETGATPEPGGLTWQGASSVGDDGTGDDHEVCYLQDHAFSGISDTDPDGVDYDLGVAISAAALNQALAAGADSALMEFDWTPSWNDLGLCSSAPMSADCDDPVVLDGAFLGALYPPLSGVGTQGVLIRYVAPVAPFTAVEVDPVGERAHGYFFLGSYRMQMIDVATGDLLLEVAMGAQTDAFSVSLDGADDIYGYGLPSTVGYAVTHWAFRGWPTTLDPASDLSLFVSPMLAQATEALLRLPAAELEAPCGDGTCTVIPTTSEARDGTFYAWATVE